MSLPLLQQAILKVIGDYGIVTSIAIERALLSARPPVVGYTSNGMFDALMTLLDGDYIEFEQLPGDLMAFFLAERGASTLGRPVRPRPARPDDRWVKAMEAELKVFASALNAQLTLTLDPYRAKLCSWYQTQHFSFDKDKYLDPPQPIRQTGTPEKVWGLKQHEHKRECVIRQIYREKICTGVISWFDGFVGDIASAVEAPRYFVISPTGRPIVILLRTKATLPRTWSRQMQALARLDKILVLPHEELVAQYDEQTENELTTVAFEGGTRLMARRIDIIPPVRFQGVVERLVS
jgi:hypothetical protein